jgi:hypothetical protein
MVATPQASAQSAPEPAYTAGDDGPGAPTVQPPTLPVEPLSAALKAIPGASADTVRRTAIRLGTFLDDMGSLGYYLSVLAAVAAGTAAVERLLTAFAAGSQARGSARRAGAVFCWAYSNWVRPPRPSEIRYYQRRTVQPPRATPVAAATPAMPEPPPMDREAELRELRIMANDPRHPFQAVARARLVELAGEPGA